MNDDTCFDAVSDAIPDSVQSPTRSHSINIKDPSLAHGGIPSSTLFYATNEADISTSYTHTPNILSQVYVTKPHLPDLS